MIKNWKNDQTSDKPSYYKPKYTFTHISFF